MNIINIIEFVIITIMMYLKDVWRCLFTPRLYKVYGDGPIEAVYQPGVLEKWADNVITVLSGLFSVALYATPVVGLYATQRVFFTAEEARYSIRCFGGLGFLYSVSCMVRALGRAGNPHYVRFMRALTGPENERVEYLQALRRYDFEFSGWPTTFHARTAEAALSWFHEHPFQNCANRELPVFQRNAVQLLAYLATHTFALRLIYPGSLALVKYYLSDALRQGRATLVENHDGLRTKIETSDQNSLDTLFVDKRASNTPKGKILIVCSEGNSGFYEVGIMATPIRAGYSVLGWNHPGFAGSSGHPSPRQERNAIEAVMQFAISDLGFDPDNIVMYGWSIGGYTAAWGALTYPVRGLILDATFDDLLPLAQNQMPISWKLIVREVVRSYVNLHIGKLVAKYSGPVHVIRRTQDEIICLAPGDLATNCGNDLIVRLINSRYSSEGDATLDELRKLIKLKDYQRKLVASSSSAVKAEVKRAVQLISKYMSDYESTHCNPLPVQQFETAMESIESARKTKLEQNM